LSRVYPRRSIVLTVTVMVMALATSAQATGSHVHISTAYELPGDRVYPEGVAADPYTGDLYAGSFVDGTVFTMTPGNRVAEVFLPAGADGRHKALGLKVDRARRLWVIDADTGVMVYDTRSRRLLARFDVTGQQPRLVNDLDITPDGSVYLTDSLRAVIYRVTPRQVAQARAHGGRAPLAPAFDLTGVLEPHPPGTVTLNGIVADPSGRYLLTVDMTGGDLYRIDPSAGEVHKVDLRDHDMSQGDGMALRNGTLWVAHPIPDANAISRWRLDRDGRTARLERRLTDQALQLPTTLIRRHGELYVVRSQFDKGGPVGPGTPQVPFTIAAVRGM
jgi:sugar lactone lactonase YvrE